ncbi:MAG: ATP-binding protein [Lacrimispora sphenoides]
MGTGLGLAIAKRIADRHSIGIEATSVPGEKTSFIFRIPWQR